jgi:hypothetical protein
VSRAVANWRVRVAGVLALELALTTPAAGWGPDGHRAIAELATERLTREAKGAVGSLLGSQSMVGVSNWADEVRSLDRPDTYRWHFVDIPLGADHYDPQRDCQKTEEGDCLLAELGRLDATLRDRSASQADRREALIFLIHFMGDLHQPLHVSDNGDQGGNRRIARIDGAGNLHAAWDSGIISASHLDADALVEAADLWLKSHDETKLAAGTYADWALEGNAIAQTVVYPQIEGDNRIDDQERVKDMEIIEQLVAKAGVRLAAVLNRVFRS